MVQFLYYPKCGTCRKAEQWLKANGVAYQGRLIAEQNPTLEELRAWHAKSGLPLKDKRPAMSEEEQLALLATDGMLVKRPLVIGEDFVLVGFRPEEWERLKP